jgi:hypothetical protein
MRSPANPVHGISAGLEFDVTGGRNADNGKPDPGLIVPVVAWPMRFAGHCGADIAK